MFCNECKVYVSNFTAHKKSNLHKSNCLINTKFDNVQVIATAFKNRIRSYRVNSIANDIHSTPEQFLNRISKSVLELIKISLEKHTALKVNLELFVAYTQPKNNEKAMKSFNTQYFQIFQNTDILSLYSSYIDNLITKCSEFELSESGWTIDSISHLEININKYNPLRAGTYVSLPAKIRNSKSCLNIQNKDDHCFLWSVMAHMYPASKNPNRVSSYPHFKNILDIRGMSFPPALDDLKTFEKNNPNISINVYGLEKNDDVSGPLYKTLKHKLTHINLLLIEQNGKSHFCLIKNIEKLVHRQLTKHTSKIHLCEECFIYFDTEQKLYSHNCARVKTILPEPNSTLAFSHFERTQRIPIVIYGDFESLLLEYSDKSKSNHIENIQAHEATCFAYYICCESKPELNEYVSYRGPNCAKKFVETISKDVKKLHQLLSVNCEMLPLSAEEKHSLQNATICHICRKSFEIGERIAADHDHFTGKYRGPSHDSCNVNAKSCEFIPILFHNFSGYDCHLFITELSNTIGRINLIPKTKEKYITLTKFLPIEGQNPAQLKFIDSFNFLNSGLDELASTLDPGDFKNLKKMYPNPHQFELLRKKGIYCYDYIDSWDRYNETELPDRKFFYSKLKAENITDENYEHAKSVWREFNIQSLGEYTDLYLKCDVLLLCDIFEKFRCMSLTYYNLDPCYYVSSPALSWDAMLLYTKIKLDLISDIEMYQMIEKGIRGGLAQCSLRHAKANNIYLSDYNDANASSYLIYLDCVNLYGFAMLQYLPTNNFVFLNDQEIDKFDVKSVSCDSPRGYILEVDLEYPRELHDDHSDLPFAPENYVPPSKTSRKLIANLHNKYKYVIHYEHLKECLNNGLKLLKIHRILAFNQGNFLEPYITLNTELRQNAKCDFEKNFFKKQVNSIYGKTIQNKRNQVDVKLVNVWRDVSNKTNKICGAEKYISAPNFKSLSVFSENLVAIQMQQSKLVLDMPIYIGFTVLELAKKHLYQFHYSVMRKRYHQNIHLCYTDTDSLLYLVYTNNFYMDMKEMLPYFDTSNFAVNNMYNMPIANMKIPGYFKDEMGGTVISEFVGLRAKLYCINTEATSIKKAKGIKKCVTKKLNMKKYKKCLYNSEELRDNMCIIKSKNHKMFTQRLNKLVLSKNDDKRQLINGAVRTLPWGHYSNIL